jgi:hypothetical protein
MRASDEIGLGHRPVLQTRWDGQEEHLMRTGTRLFSDLEQPARLEFVSATPTGGGVTELVFRRVTGTST